ncbi:hypothetical protein D6745_05210 [Candidatus Woesearchaeota archaeon]|nr:MAG: hypothetical protein D6745_05210 [Candidatus Woesearchaeota archaeon]
MKRKRGDYKERLQLLQRYIRLCENYKETVKRTHDDILGMLLDEEITYYEYERMMNHAFKGKKPEEWNRYYDELISRYKKEVREIRLNQGLDIAALALVFLIALVPAYWATTNNLQTTGLKGAIINNDFPVNEPPKIKSYKPEMPNPTIRPGQTAAFSVEAEDPEGGNINYEWYLDGRLESKEKIFTYSPTREDLGYHTAEVMVFDPEEQFDHFSWDVQVK